VKQARAVQSVRVAGVVAAIVATLGALPAAHTHAPVSATLTPSAITGVSGQRKTVALRADMGITDKLSSYHAVVSWDSTVIRLDSVGQSADFGAPIVRIVNGAAVDMTAQPRTAGVGGSFSLATFYFRFVNDTVGRSTPITTTFSEFNSADFLDLLPGLSAPGGTASVLPPAIAVGFSPDSTLQRVGFKPQFDFLMTVADTDVLLGSYTADVEWNGNIMTLDSVTTGDLGNLQSNMVGFETVRLTAADAAGSGGSVVAAHLYFSFLGTTYPRQSALFTNMLEIHAASTFADLIQGITAKNGHAVIGGWLRGDFDVNDSIGALDAQLILQGVVGLIPQALPQGDADCNAALSAKDAQIVLNYVVGNTTSFCVGKIQ
jgi:hypothetical protein